MRIVSQIFSDVLSVKFVIEVENELIIAYANVFHSIHFTPWFKFSTAQVLELGESRMCEGMVQNGNLRDGSLLRTMNRKQN